MKIKAFYSDPHFGHVNIIKFTERPFENVDQMNEAMIQRYNETINPGDTVFWLGDCVFGQKKDDRLRSIMPRLNGEKILIVGNHDRSLQKMTTFGFNLVMEECFMNIAGVPCRLKHYPYEGGAAPDVKFDDRYQDLRPPKIPGEVLIHGHTHSAMKFHQNMVHVGVDAWDCAPAPYEEVEAIVKMMAETKVV